MIRSCIENDCYEFTIDSTQLCEVHLAKHIKRCQLISDIHMHQEKIAATERELRALNNGEGVKK